jgi:hypothetical protein
MTPAKSGDQNVEAGDVFVAGIEKTGVRDFGFCAQRESPVLQGRKWLREEERGSQDQKDGTLVYTERDLEVQNGNSSLAIR